MEKFTDVDGKPVFVNTSKVTHVSIDAEKGVPTINFDGGSSITVVDNLNAVLTAINAAAAVA